MVSRIGRPGGLPDDNKGPTERNESKKSLYQKIKNVFKKNIEFNQEKEIRPVSPNSLTSNETSLSSSSPRSYLTGKLSKIESSSRNEIQTKIEEIQQKISAQKDILNTDPLSMKGQKAAEKIGNLKSELEVLTKKDISLDMTEIKEKIDDLDNFEAVSFLDELQSKIDKLKDKIESFKVSFPYLHSDSESFDDNIEHFLQIIGQKLSRSEDLGNFLKSLSDYQFEELEVKEIVNKDGSTIKVFGEFFVDVDRSLKLQIIKYIPEERRLERGLIIHEEQFKEIESDEKKESLVASSLSGLKQELNLDDDDFLKLSVFLAQKPTKFSALYASEVCHNMHYEDILHPMPNSDMNSRIHTIFVKEDVIEITYDMDYNIITNTAIKDNIREIFDPKHSNLKGLLKKTYELDYPDKKLLKFLKTEYRISTHMKVVIPKEEEGGKLAFGKATAVFWVDEMKKTKS